MNNWDIYEIIDELEISLIGLKGEMENMQSEIEGIENIIKAARKKSNEDISKYLDEAKKELSRQYEEGQL